MASDSISARYSEYEAALAVIRPQIKGCINKINDDISPDLKQSFQARLAFLQEREKLLVAAIEKQKTADSDVELLEDHGHPEIPKMEIPASQLAEIQEEGAADDAAAAGFESFPPASSIGIALGAPSDKPLSLKLKN